MPGPRVDAGDEIRQRLGVAILQRDLRGSDALRGLALELAETDPTLAAIYIGAAETLQSIETNLKDEFNYELPKL